MSMISEQVKELREMADYWRSNGLEPQNALRKAADTIEALSEKLAAKNNNGWIPCDKELPPQPKENPLFENKPLEPYLVSLNKTDYPWRAFWNGKFFTDGWIKIKPDAWQPLPEPYKEEEV